MSRSLFNTGKKEESLTILERLTAKHHYPEAWASLGHVRRESGDLKGSEDAFEKALELIPAFSEAHMGAGVTLLAQANADKALRHFNKCLALCPGNSDASANAALCLHMLRRYDEAKSAFRRILELDPRNAFVQRQFAKLLIETGEIQESINIQKGICQHFPGLPDAWAELASTLEISNRLDECGEVLSEAATRFPSNPIILYEIAKLDRRKGRISKALAGLTSIDPSLIPPHLKHWFFYELGMTMDLSGDFPGAYRSFSESNLYASKGMRSKTTNFQVFDNTLDAMDDWIDTGAPEGNTLTSETVDDGSDLVFLLGFPRSGTTLLDVMLSGHPATICLEEKQTIEHIFHDVDSQHGGFPHGLSFASPKEIASLRKKYREILERNGVPQESGKLIIDKMPIRTPYAAFILRLFPRSRILFSLRHPYDVVLSNFMQNYAANEIFVHFYTLEESARIYDRTMRIWKKSIELPGEKRCHYVRYEKLISETSTTLAGACSFLGIPYDDTLSDHRKSLASRGRIGTNSYHQVTEAIYQRSNERWRNYRVQMESVSERLEAHCRYFGYDCKDS